MKKIWSKFKRGSSQRKNHQESQQETLLTWNNKIVISVLSIFVEEYPELSSRNIIYSDYDPFNQEDYLTSIKKQTYRLCSALQKCSVHFLHLLETCFYHVFTTLFYVTIICL